MAWLIALSVLLVLVVLGLLARSLISDRWDRLRGVDPKVAEAGDEATLLLATHGAALPMPDRSFDKPR